MATRLVLASVFLVTASAFGADAPSALCTCIDQATTQLQAKAWTPVGADCKAIFLRDQDLKGLAAQKTMPADPQRAKLLKALKGKQCVPQVVTPETDAAPKPEVPSLDARLTELKTTTQQGLEKLQNQIDPLERWQGYLKILAVISLFGLAGLLFWHVLQAFGKKPESFASRSEIDSLRTSLNSVRQTADNAIKQQTDVMNAIAQLSSQINTLKTQRDRGEGAGSATPPPREGRGASITPVANQMGTSMESSNVAPATGSSSAARLIAAYNAAARSQRTADYRGFETAAKGVAFFSLANARERTQNRDLAPVFRTFETGTYCAVQTEDGTYAVFPTLGKFPWGLRRDAAMNLVFRFPDEPGEPDLGVSQAASFRRDGDEWTLLSMGALERL